MCPGRCLQAEHSTVKWRLLEKRGLANLDGIMLMYYCGFNGFGQLGTGSSYDCLTLSHLENITDVTFSFSSALISSGDDVFISGFVGQNANQLKKLKPPEKGKISQVSCSSKQILLVMDVGECWQYVNSNESWKKLPDFLSVENDEIATQNNEIQGETYDYEVMNVKKNRNHVKKISCGDTLSIALDCLGRVYSIPSPLELSGVKIVDIACGFEHCILLDETGVVYSWGSGTRGQLGHGETEFKDLPPRKVETFCGLKVRKISAGGWHSAVVTDSGDLYTWGWNNAGQLGFPMTKSNLRSVNQYKKTSDQIDQEYVASLKLISPCSEQKKVNCIEGEGINYNNKKIKRTKLSCSDDVTGSSIENSDCLQKSETGKYDCHDEGGEGCSSKSAVPVAVLPEPWPVDFPLGIDVNVVDVACGNRHTVVLLDVGSVWGCGWNAYGQLGKPPHTLQYSSQMVEMTVPFDIRTSKIVSVHCGAWNSAILVEKQNFKC